MSDNVVNNNKIECDTTRVSKTVLGSRFSPEHYYLARRLGRNGTAQSDQLQIRNAVVVCGHTI